MIKKFKTFEDASRDLWEMNPSEIYFKRVRNFYGLASFLVKHKIERGIFKFKTFEDAEKHLSGVKNSLEN